MTTKTGTATDMKMRDEGEAPSVSDIRFLPHFSVYFFDLARKHAQDANICGTEFPIPLATGAVIMAATALESFVNEQTETFASCDASLEAACSELQPLQGLSIPAKWSILVRIAFGETFEIGREPYQSFSSLIELRNVLVHRAARFRAGGEFPSRRIENLSSKYAFSSRPNAPHLPWECRVLNALCARWAVNTASEMVAEHYRLAQAAEDKPVGGGRPRVKVAKQSHWERLP
jgi:hypothetical protein